MPDTKHEARSLAETWARTLGVPKERLAAIVKQVVEERQTLGRMTAAPEIAGR